jgi:pimeloyl-ACP methyl ester carboxylesterase
MFVQIADHLVHCVVEGPEEAPPLLLLHSIGTTQHIWDPQAVALARRFRVIRPDLRGHGLSGVTPGDYSMALLAADALALLDALDIPCAHVAGCSIGGRIALQLAALAPARIASLILVGTALAYPEAATGQTRIAAVRAGGTAVLADAVMPRWVAHPDTPAGQGLRTMLLRTDREGYAAAGSCSPRMTVAGRAKRCGRSSGVASRSAAPAAA